MSAHRSGIQLTARGTDRDLRHHGIQRGVRGRGRGALGRHRRVEAVPAAGRDVHQTGLDRHQGRGRRAAARRSPRPSATASNRVPRGQRACGPASRVDRAVLRLRRRDAPQPGGDVSGRRTVHPLLRRRRARAGAVRPRHRGGQLPLASCNPRSAGLGGHGWASTFGHGDLSSHRPRRVHAPVGAGPRCDEGRHGPPRRTPREDDRRAIAVTCSHGWATGWPPRSQRHATRSRGRGSFQQALAAEPWGTARAIAGAHRTAHRRGGDRRRHRVRQPADQSVFPVDDRRPRRADRRFRRHRDADARSSCPAVWSSSISASTGCATWVVPPGSFNWSATATARTSRRCGHWIRSRETFRHRSVRSSDAGRRGTSRRRRSTTSRVVTVTGVGGVGKTRLALQVAADVLPHYRDGAWLVELGPCARSRRRGRRGGSSIAPDQRRGKSLEDSLLEMLTQ